MTGILKDKPGMQTTAWGGVTQFELEATSRFSVFNSCENQNGATYHLFSGSPKRASDSVDAASEGIIWVAETGGSSRERITSNGNESISSNLSVHGCCIIANFFDPVLVRKVELSLQSLVTKLQRRYDRITDDFDGFDSSSVLESFGIIRCPRIGRGKHNMHFDPYESTEHIAVLQLLESASLTALLSAHTGMTCSIRETGLSLTKPHSLSNEGKSSGDKNSTGSTHIGENALPDSVGITYGQQEGGEGMEWHSDGAKGEFTMLMSFSDIHPDMGSLHVVPGSHLDFKEGVGHGDVGQKDYSAVEVQYAYRAGQPMLIDARTLHSVSRNVSDKWRIVLWCILDCY